MRVASLSLLPWRNDQNSSMFTEDSWVKKSRKRSRKEGDDILLSWSSDGNWLSLPFDRTRVLSLENEVCVWKRATLTPIRSNNHAITATQLSVENLLRESALFFMKNTIETTAQTCNWHTSPFIVELVVTLNWHLGWKVVCSFARMWSLLTQ